MTNTKQIIFVCGATASGKSHLALQLAREFNGEIINADSMQVYDALRLLTARPSAADEAQTPHHLYGHVAAHEPYNVALWQSAAMAAIAQTSTNTAIVVGGTGFYFHSLTHGLATIPDIDEAVRAAWRTRAETEGTPALYALLQQQDAHLAARLDPNDTQRILRGLEVYSTTGRTLSAWQTDTAAKPPLQNATIAKILLNPSRDWLYERCNSRFATMLENGAIEEVAAFAKLAVPMASPLRKALGVSELLSLQAGLCDQETALITAQQRTRNYAKRQMTWFRNRMADWQPFVQQDYIPNQDKIFAFITKNGLTGQ